MRIALSLTLAVVFFLCDVGDAWGELAGLLGSETAITGGGAPGAVVFTECGFPPVLLTTAWFYGTLAAIRVLGRAGIPVVLADAHPLSFSNWSRYLGEKHRCPDIREDTKGFLQWLLDFGRTSAERHVLCPTCDDTAWLYAKHRVELEKYFHVAPISIETYYTFLNKRHLFERCRHLGIDTPQAWFPESDDDVRALAKTLRFPVLLKPASQILFNTREKGEVVDTPDRLLARYRAFAARPYGKALVEFDATVVRPIVQEYFPSGADSIYNLAGYVGPGGDVSVFRASTKVMQIPRRLGVGVCFQETPVREELTERVRALCASVGYHGIFEVEFIQADGRSLVIDVNPRFYSEMAFEIGRGMSLPLFAYHSALGDTDALRELAATDSSRAGAPRAHLHRVGFELSLQGGKFAGALPPAEEASWRAWQSAHPSTDAVWDEKDPIPAFFDAAMCLYRQFRYSTPLLRTALRNRVLNGLRKPPEGEPLQPPVQPQPKRNATQSSS